MIQDTAILQAYNRTVIENRTEAFEWYHFKWPWTIANSRSRHYLTLNISETAQDTYIQCLLTTKYTNTSLLKVRIATAAIAILNFPNLQFMSRDISYSMPFCFLVQTYRNQTVSCLSTYGQETIFNMAAVRDLEFKKKPIFGTWLSSGSKSAVVYQISLNSHYFSLKYGDITIFNFAAVRYKMELGV